MDDNAKLDDITKLAIAFNEAIAKAPEPLDMVKIYDSDDQESTDAAVYFVFDACGTKSYGLLEEAWAQLDVTRMTTSAMVGMLSVSHMIQDKSLIPGRPAYVERCRAELQRRGEPEDRINRLTNGLR